MSEQLLKETKERMQKTELALQRELGAIRAGRANASLLDRIQVEYYGAPTPLNQLAQISIPEPRMLMITPYDKSSIKEIERAILQSDIGISPSSDGNVVRLVIPQLTTERRKELAKEVGKDSENAKISIRNIRRDAMDALKKSEKNGDITEDDLRHYESDVQDLTNKSVANIDAISAEKEKEILDV
ncbi:ribosome recycling factor [Pisciglobus halotolerans]|uniref:Ribosome-recycling factor n=1 Tax=Pisciglobus halotolerans TaxID=745365 RepID=A0A1I3BYQ5_9LACT|nr:ribosome recycling factor [Pisciglobus halotolerans]SFH67437.1 ribosome recycling factor [Pisciglobus halotolerans]